MTGDDLRAKILELTRQYYAAQWPKGAFVPGQTAVPYAGRVFDAEEVVNLVDSSLDFWLTTGRFAAQFEKEFATFLKARYAMLCNSGSSANLLAVTALTSAKLGEKRLVPGDEVVTVAAGFPTTVNPILQNNLVPVFLDVEMGTYNIDVNQLEAAVSKRTRAIMVAHTLGNPFNLAAVMEFAKRHDLFVVEDNCDALGARYNGQLTGGFGNLSTYSFYPAHHITMGEGGAVVTNDRTLKTVVESFRDWGRDCWCDPGKDNTCGKRFGWQLGDLPPGYDHKFIYSHIGYNLKLTDMQAAVGVAQLGKLPEFIEARRRNWQFLYDGLKEFEEFLLLPQATANSQPSWFGFIMTVQPTAPFGRRDIVTYLERRKIATRQLFAGNLTRHPAYVGANYRQVGELPNTDRIMRDTFWVGVYPGLDEARLEFMLSTLREFLSTGGKVAGEAKTGGAGDAVGASSSAGCH